MTKNEMINLLMLDMAKWEFQAVLEYAYECRQEILTNLTEDELKDLIEMHELNRR